MLLTFLVVCTVASVSASVRSIPEVEVFFLIQIIFFRSLFDFFLESQSNLFYSVDILQEVMIIKLASY